MPEIDLCIEPFFLGIDTIEKIKKVEKLGFVAVEFWFWDHEFDGDHLVPCKKDIRGISSVCNDLNITITDLVVNSPDGSIGGFLTKPEDREKYLERLKETIDIAHTLKCKKLITCTGNIITGKSFQEQFDCVVKTLSEAAEIANKEGIILVLEALNSLKDHPGYFLTSSRIGFDIIRLVNSSGLKLLYDIYHMHIMGRDHTTEINENLSLIGHFHFAGVPGRNEIYSGEINYTAIVNKLINSEYEGYFGLEYWPIEKEEISLTKTLEFFKKINNPQPIKSDI